MLQIWNGIQNDVNSELNSFNFLNAKHLYCSDETMRRMIKTGPTYGMQIKYTSFDIRC